MFVIARYDRMWMFSYRSPTTYILILYVSKRAVSWEHTRCRSGVPRRPPILIVWPNSWTSTENAFLYGSLLEQSTLSSSTTASRAVAIPAIDAHLRPSGVHVWAHGPAHLIEPTHSGRSARWANSGNCVPHPRSFHANTPRSDCCRRANNRSDALNSICCTRLAARKCPSEDTPGVARTATDSGGRLNVISFFVTYSTLNDCFEIAGWILHNRNWVR